ncbi:MAG: methionine synthase [Bacteroidales bacterium]|nr:methionine synthase [Bacteroidales bacterium]
MGSIQDALARRILVIDGAMGTMLQRHALTEKDFRGDVFTDASRELKGNNECLNLTRPELIRGVHEAYIAAGADIIETNTFSANRISQAEYGCGNHAREMAMAGAKIAREAADRSGRKVWVAGSIGPTGKSLTLASDLSKPAFRAVDFDEMAEAYAEQISGLAEGGADLLLIETCFDALNAKAAIHAAGKVAPQLPVMVSVAVSDMSGRTLTGQTLEAFYTSVRHAGLLSFGLNCSFGASTLEQFVVELDPALGCALSFYPNAGLPNEMGQYDESPQVMGEAIGRIARRGLVNIVGGCCGTSPEHIAAIAGAVAGVSPRALPEPERVRPSLTVCGLECATIDKERSLLTNIGERTNVAGSRKFARLIAEGAYDDALQIAAGQIEGGASIIDINMDDAMLDSKVEMVKFLRYVSNDPAVAKAALMIDSSDFDTVVAGLKNTQGKCIVNSISLKEGEESFLDKARQIKALGAAVMVMAFDEEGQATSYQRKIDICARAYRLLTEKLGFAPSDIIFDVNVLSIGTGIEEHARYGIDFIEAVRWIKSNLPGALTSGGISNLSFSFRGNNPVREAMHSVFLYHAGAAGLDMGIVNPAMLQVYDEIEPGMLRCVEDVVLNRDAEATERLIEKAQQYAGMYTDRKEEKEETSEDRRSVEERLSDALVKGQEVALREDVLEALGKFGRAVDVIEGPLMSGMEKVGRMFGEGRMFLPQVVKSAKIMRDAVDILQPYMTGETSDAAEGKPKVVIATVKGDVHDIGKNITAIVLNCNGFLVKDLGVMVPEDTILAEAEAFGADIIAVSGLITPSLSRMEDLCRKMADRRMATPLFVGGATTSALHTAVKLAPVYSHVFHGTDASASAVMAKKYVSDPRAFEKAAHEEQARIRSLYESRGNSAPEAPAEASPSVAENVAVDKRIVAEEFLTGKVFSDIPARELDIDEVMPWFDWKMLYAVWGFKYGNGENEDTEKLKTEASKVLRYMKKYKACRISIAARFLDCVSEGDDIVEVGGRRWPMMRQENGSRSSLADFVVPAGSGESGQMGLFAISVHRGHAREAVCDCAACTGDSYESLLERSVRLTLAEAASSWLDNHLASQLPADRPEMKICKPAAGYSSCPDHTLKRDILPLLPDGDRLGITFTESYAMIPDASICGLIFAHPKAGYPEIRKASELSVKEYALRRGLTADEVRTFLSHLL